jgi:SAM-dependent methyltransferase
MRVPAAEILKDFPRGDTCPGVSRLTASLLLDFFGREGKFTLLDLPCGSGQISVALKDLFPLADIFSADFKPCVLSNQSDKTASTYHYIRLDASSGTLPFGENLFDVVLVISGIAEFGNRDAFLSEVYRILKPGGYLFISNDNQFTVRDRFLYLLSGRTRSSRANLENIDSTWRTLPAPQLIKMLGRSGFYQERIIYTKPKVTELLFFPFAAPLMLSQFLNNLSEGIASQSIWRKIWQPISFFSRHYLVVCRKNP